MASFNRPDPRRNFNGGQSGPRPGRPYSGGQRLKPRGPFRNQQPEPQNQMPEDGLPEAPLPEETMNSRGAGPVYRTAQLPTIEVDGVLELSKKGHGFLRSAKRDLLPQTTDPFVPINLIQRYNLREGLLLTCQAHPGPHGQAPRIIRLDAIDGTPAADFKPRAFESLTPVDPTETIRLETGAEPLTMRVMDLLTPIGKGQRGLIVAPPRTGKTILLQHIAKAISENHPEMHLIVLLVDERPEEVTEIRRTVRGTVIASSSDHDAANHVRVAELVVERARRLAEQGKQVFVLLDSLTRLARAYNKNVGNSGRTMSGGVDVRALEVPKRLFGCARAFEEGGSITVIGTALIETGSRMDDVIFQELKGTGNMELVLDRKLADKRIFPAMDISQSGTRKEERLIPAETLRRIHAMRRILVDIKNPAEGMQKLLSKLSTCKSNAEFLELIKLPSAPQR